MKIVIYDSQFGNTEKIAKVIGNALGYDTKVQRVNEVLINNLNDLNNFNNLNILIVGSPTHGGRPSDPMQRFFNQLGPGSLKNVKAAAFDTGIPAEGQKWFMRKLVGIFGYASKRIAALLESKGATVIGAETFCVLGREGPLKDGELERAAEWARKLAT